MKKFKSGGKEEVVSGRPMMLKGIVGYQEDAIVSRTLIDDKCGTVTLFAFDGGQGLSEHTSPYNAMVQVLEGQAEVCIAGRRSTVREGEFIMMPANRPHSLSSAVRFKMLLTLVRGGKR